MAIFGRFLERVYQDPKRDGYQRGTTDLENSNSQFDPKVGAELYHRYLDEHVMADELGFDAIMLNEHHQSAFCMGAQPNVESSILARVTKNIRIVMAGNVLPIWDNPLLLAEQIAMISQISRGRLVNGWVRGGGREHIANTAQTPYNWERFKEAHALIRKSWEVPGPWRWEGEHFNYRNVNPWARPYQTPMPQWQAGVISRNTLEWAADNRYPYIMIATKPEATAEAFQYYRDYAKELGWEAGSQHLGYMIKTHVEATDEKAYEVGKKFLRGTANPFIEGNEGKVKGFLSNPPGMIDRRRLLPTVGATTAGRRPDNPTSAGTAAERRTARRSLNYDEQLAQREIIVGSPKTVIAKVRHEMELLRPGMLFFWDGEGSMTHEESVESMTLMGKEVLPALREIGKELGLVSAFEVDPLTNTPIGQ